MALNSNGYGNVFPDVPTPQRPDQLIPPLEPEGSRVIRLVDSLKQAVVRMRPSMRAYAMPDEPGLEDLLRVPINIDYIDPRDEAGAPVVLPPDVRRHDTESNESDDIYAVAMHGEEMRRGEVTKTGAQRYFETRWRFFPLPRIGSVMRQQAEMKKSVAGAAFVDTMQSILYERSKYVEEVAGITPRPLTRKWAAEMRRQEQGQEQELENESPGQEALDAAGAEPRQAERANNGKPRLTLDELFSSDYLGAPSDLRFPWEDEAQGDKDATPQPVGNASPSAEVHATTPLEVVADEEASPRVERDRKKTEWPPILQYPEREDGFEGLPEPRSAQFLREFAALSMGAEPDPKSPFNQAFAHLRNYGGEGNNLIDFCTDPSRVRGIRRRYDAQKPILNFYNKLVEQDRQQFGEEWLENYTEMFPVPLPPAKELTRDQEENAERSKVVFKETDGEYFLKGRKEYDDRRDQLEETIEDGIKKVEEFIFHPHQERNRLRHGRRGTSRPTGQLSPRHLANAVIASRTGEENPVIFRAREPRRLGTPEAFDEPGGIDFLTSYDVTGSTVGRIDRAIVDTAIITQEINDGCNQVIEDAEAGGRIPRGGDHKNSMSVLGFGYQFEQLSFDEYDEWERTMRQDLARREVPDDEAAEIIADLTPYPNSIWPMKLKYINATAEERDKVEPFKELFRQEARILREPAQDITDVAKIRTINMYDDGGGYRTHADEALKIGLEQAKASRDSGRNPVYIHVTDGGSQTQQEDQALLEQIRDTGAMVYCIVIQQPADLAARSGFTYGEIVTISNPSELPDVLANIQAECMQLSLSGKLAA